MRDSSPEDAAPIVSTLSSEPTREYETYRRRAYRDVQELWFYARAKLESLKKEGGGIEAKVKDALGELETLIVAKGNEIRDMKANKADKAAIKAAVDELLALKEK